MAVEAICSISTCDKRASVRGWCDKHYTRWKRHGDPNIAKKRWRNTDDPPPQTRECRKCGRTRPLSHFAKCSRSGLGVRHRCRDCTAEDAKSYRADNAERERQRAKTYSAKNRAKVAARLRRWRAENRDRYLETAARWRALNPDKVRARVARRVAKEMADPKIRMKKAITACINQSIRRGTKARRRTAEILGYTYLELAKHLERQFQRGMTWENYGEWHIDHIIPVASFDFKTPDDPEFRACWALTNLRPLWAAENRSKRDKRLHLI